KNESGSAMDVWVNGSYIGWLKPGETRYSVSDGFVTDDSFRPTPDGGRTPMVESHGGWDNSSDKVTVTIQFRGGEMKRYEFSVEPGGHSPSREPTAARR